jgi:hypothetical protein
VDPDDLGLEEGHNLSEAEEEEEEEAIPAAVPVTNESSSLHDDLPVTKSFKIIMNVQLALIIFLSFFWLYERRWEWLRAAL